MNHSDYARFCDRRTIVRSSSVTSNERLNLHERVKLCPQLPPNYSKASLLRAQQSLLSLKVTGAHRVAWNGRLGGEPERDFLNKLCTSPQTGFYYIGDDGDGERSNEMLQAPRSLTVSEIRS